MGFSRETSPFSLIAGIVLYSELLPNYWTSQPIRAARDHEIFWPWFEGEVSRVEG